MEDYKLTKNEKTFLIEFLELNGCGAKTPGDLLMDNYSCQCLMDLDENIDVSALYSPRQVRGFLSSLTEKNVLMFEERQTYKGENDSEPHLWWAENSFLESLDANINFGDI